MFTRRMLLVGRRATLPSCSTLAPVRIVIARAASHIGRGMSISAGSVVGAGTAGATVAGTAARSAAAAVAAAAPATVGAEALATPAVGWWLLGCSASVFGMVILGGVTRLTRSGLSMTDWKPQGSLPPLNDVEWTAEFEKYKRFPEFQRLHPDMTLEDFKGIFWLEWGHRMAGRAVGIVFGVPLIWFAARGSISRRLAPTLVLLFAMGGSQGLVGWWMVKSGLQEPANNSDGVPRVSPYRLAAHLTAAFAIYSLLLYTSLGVMQPRAAAVSATLLPLARRVRLLAALVGVTAISGAFVAGMQAGLAFNTFPLMEGRVVPEGYFELEPAYRNFFESVPSVQLHHRALALSTLAATCAFWFYTQRMPMSPALRRSSDLLLLAAWGQVGLGIATLLNAVPVWLGSAHQAGALTLFSLTLLTIHTVRVPSTASLLRPRLAATLAKAAKA